MSSSFRRIGRLILLGVVSHVAGACAHLPPPAPVARAAPSAITAADATCLPAPEIASGKVGLPPCDPAARPAWRDFWTAAGRALRQLYIDNNEDTAVIENVLDQLLKDPNLAPFRTGWQPILEAGIERGQLLARTAPLRRLLAISFFEAYYDGIGKAWCGLDKPACEQALSLADSSSLAKQDLLLSTWVEPVGEQPLGSLLALCRRAIAPSEKKTRSTK